MKKKDIPVYQMVIDPDNFFTDLTNIDPVDYPAIERNFLLLNSTNAKKIEFNTVAEKRITVGPVLIPNRLIYRVDPFTNEEFYVKIDERNIENALNCLMEHSNMHNIQLNHEGELVNGIFLNQIWIVKNPKNDLSNEFGFKNIPRGTLMSMYRYRNQEVWDKYIKSGILKGYSIQGWFEHVFIKTIEVPVIERMRKEREGLLQTANSNAIKLSKMKI